MKWYQVDSDTPNDPKIKALIRKGLDDGGPARAAALVGNVFLLWCYIANHGEAAPGLGVRQDGTPLPLDEMADECLLDVPGLRSLLDFLALKGLVDPGRWQAGIVFLPGMLKRADTYAKRKGRIVEGSNTVRTLHPESPLQDKTIQNTTEDLNPSGFGQILPVPDLLTEAGPDQVDALVKLWNDHRKPGPKVMQVTPQRRRVYLKALAAKPDLSDWHRVILWLNRERWCNAGGGGDHSTWRATLDWAAKPGKLAELLDRSGPTKPKRADGLEGRDAARGRTGFKRGEFAQGLMGGDDDTRH